MPPQHNQLIAKYFTMSFYSYKDIIEEGDLVLAFISRSDTKPIHVTKGEILNTRYGHFKHESMIGLRYGEQMEGANGYGFIHLLHPTPELWTLSLPHRTQIVYTHDAAYIMQRLNVVAGTRVIEAGTGSGSFTHSFARTVGKTGTVFSYEFHEPRYVEAKAEFEQHQLVNTHITHRDVCNDGFDIESIPSQFQLANGGVDADVVFLDLPSPWTAIDHLDTVMNSQKTVGICCFSPCIEQVNKTIEALQNKGWINIELVEVAGKRWEARQEMVRDVSDVVRRLKDIHSRRGKGIEAHKKGVLDEAKAGEKRLAEEKEHVTKVQNSGKGFNPFGRGERVKEGDEKYNWRNVTKVESEVKSHTSYLTFAVKVPDIKL